MGRNMKDKMERLLKRSYLSNLFFSISQAFNLSRSTNCNLNYRMPKSDAEEVQTCWEDVGNDLRKVLGVELEKKNVR